MPVNRFGRAPALAFRHALRADSRALRQNLGQPLMDSSLEDRLIALESRLAHHERMADEMSDVLATQQRTIDLLTAHIYRLRDRVKDVEMGADRSPQDDKPPPHY